MRIRPFSPDDFESMYRVNRQVFGETAWSQRDFRDHLSHPNIGGFVLEVPGTTWESNGMTKRILPSVQGFIVFRGGPRRAVRLDLIAIASAFRNLGHGAQLLRSVENLGKRIRAYVPEESLDAQLFFRAIGFRAVRIKENWRDCLLLRKGP
jgi:ribosomal protein S18 acetylase RimI-like enzyme